MAIEAIWGDLLASPEQVESPGWHQEALKETEARVAAGLEEPIDWEQAKAKLRKEFE
ncbi:MAG: acyl-protein synthetase [Puniceicoccaceae bacterium]|nr:MAG: acyl-protein synthetase [Puniceicoccaceae bacterium]